MKHRTLRGVAALTLGAALVLSGCSSDGGGDETSSSPSASDGASDAPTASPEDVAALEAVTVTGDPGAEPTLEFEAPLEVSAAVTRITDEGTGDELTDGMQVTMHYVAYDGATGERQGSTWEGDTPQSFVLGDPQFDLLTEPLSGQKVGTRLLFAGPDGNGGTVLNLIEVVDAQTIPDRAEGEAVTPAEGLPVVTLDDTGKPSIDIPEGYEAPTELVVQPLIKGSGAEVTSDQTVIAHYTGWKLDGEQFDSSWDRGEPTSFPLTGVIPGWTEGLSGQTVGSQVLLVIPAAQAYGEKSDANTSELAGETLVFVVDILGAS
ncbi:FKBP-type peptidyl-prolyl cis-trans isomerase [Cellulosimicrobium sp. TH-20]|uniref:FKBP-type peptidyl-prolyl cis-trans isomerase n=1 Tax=Cellulosimicrobium sp. TH-20 TaxID=1980001 RepID=UPI0011A182EB|nr:FKBP-type peptidyl-prolyl cis-trans isomerase [Cellulosimicrobium sp. TH-20]